MKKLNQRILIFLISMCSIYNTSGQDVKIIRGSDYFDSTAVKSTPKKENPPNRQNIKYHTVVKSQTLYSISKMYDTSVEQIKAWNNFSSNSISVGQKIIVYKAENDEPNLNERKEVIVPAIVPVAAKPPVENNIEKKEAEINAPVILSHEEFNEDGTVGFSDNNSCCEPAPPKLSEPVETKAERTDELSNEKLIFGNGRREINETGMAICMDEEDVNPEKYYAFHNKAPIGTIIMIVNLSNSQKIYVKVIGTLSNSFENEGAIIKISKKSAEKLGVTGKKFEAGLLYGVNEE